jgi:hypothetical protein
LHGRRSSAARGFFQALITGNSDFGRPVSIEIIFGRWIAAAHRLVLQCVR